MAKKTTRYIPCDEADIPAKVQFDVQAQDQGQMIERAWGGFDRAEHGPGAPYMRIIDRSDGSTSYYRRVRRVTGPSRAQISHDPAVMRFREGR